MTYKLDEAVGLLKRGTIVKYLPDKGVLQVRLAGTPAIKGKQAVPINVQAPHSMFYNNGLFMGSMPVEGTPVIVGQGRGGEYHFVSFLSEDHPLVPDLKLGVLLIQANDDTKITLDVDNDIYIGSSTNNIHIDTGVNLISTNMYNSYEFTQATRHLNGVIKRDLKYNTQFSQHNKLESDSYDSKFRVIGLDPTITSNDVLIGQNKNPPLVEDREIIYEFQYLSNIEDDKTESIKYGPATTSENTTTDFSFPNRRLSRADTLSLSLVAPNFLMETVKGTVVDIFGNILDLNRVPLPIGFNQGQNTLDQEQSTDKVSSFLLIRELERKSIAYHFEINARKDLNSGNSSIGLPDVFSTDNYARSRSRFFLDIDKEGQFKLNVPASSEKGNIPLLTRYENYSTFGDDDNNNPHKLVYRKDNTDIHLDSFASPKLTPVSNGFKATTDGVRGSIALEADGGGNGAPQDRTSGQHIKHGTVFHDIMQTCFTHQNNRYINFPSPGYMNRAFTSSIPSLTTIANDKIVVSGPNANGGGRSGSLNFDGSIEMNIGANTVDRQSWWLDTAGGVVANIGRDIRGRSVIANTGGDFYLQVGGYGVIGDTRFPDDPTKGAVLDLRILGSGGYCHMIRIDDNGIVIMTPGNLGIHAKGDLELTSDRTIRVEAPKVTIQKRLVLNAPMGSI